MSGSKSSPRPSARPKRKPTDGGPVLRKGPFEQVLGVQSPAPHVVGFLVHDRVNCRKGSSAFAQLEANDRRFSRRSKEVRSRRDRSRLGASRLLARGSRAARAAGGR